MKIPDSVKDRIKQLILEGLPPERITDLIFSSYKFILRPNSLARIRNELVAQEIMSGKDYREIKNKFHLTIRNVYLIAYRKKIVKKHVNIKSHKYEIIALRQSGLKLDEIAKKFNVCLPTITRILKGTGLPRTLKSYTEKTEKELLEVVIACPHDFPEEDDFDLRPKERNLLNKIRKLKRKKWKLLQKKKKDK